MTKKILHTMACYYSLEVFCSLLLLMMATLLIHIPGMVTVATGHTHTRLVVTMATCHTPSMSIYTHLVSCDSGHGLDDVRSEERADDFSDTWVVWGFLFCSSH